MKFKRKVLTLTAVFAAALALVLYPFFANIHNNRVAQELIAAYEDSVSEISEETYEEQMALALAWNQSLAAAGGALYGELEDGTQYEELLNLSGNGVMGYIEIPKIGVSLPIYHYTTDEVLAKGVGHMESSSLPVGGDSTHCILTGHRGLPGSKLFTDLDQLEIGDIFYIYVFGEILAYEVTEIQVVEPEDVDSLKTVQGEDLCTLVTCTPYGINSHRLLVTGTRTEYDAENGTASAQGYTITTVRDSMLLYAAAAEAAAYCLALLVLARRNRRGTEEQG